MLFIWDMYLIYNLWEWMHNSMLFLSLTLENLSYSCVLNDPLVHRIHRRSMWKKTIHKTKKIRILPLALCVCVCKRACVCNLDPMYTGLTMHIHAAGQRNPSRSFLV